MTRVTTVIPTVGRESIGRAIGSVLDQGSSCQALVVCDRDSEFASMRRTFASERVTVVKGAGLGGGSARLLGTKLATSEVVAYLDDDDYWLPGKIDAQLKHYDEWRARGFRPLVTTLVANAAFGASGSPSAGWISNGETTFSWEVALQAMLERKSLRFDSAGFQSSCLLLSREHAVLAGWPETPVHQDWQFIRQALAVEGSVCVRLDAPLTVVDRTGSDSVSRQRSTWLASAEWIESLPATVPGRAVADFAMCQVLKPALVSRDFKGVSASVSLLARNRALPHSAAVVVAAGAAVSHVTRARRRHRVARSPRVDLPNIQAQEPC